MMYEDTYRARQANEKKLQHELQSIDVLQKYLLDSNEQTNRMTNLLSHFEQRLSALNDHIMPVYEATNKLQIKYKNIQKTVDKLENIMEHYENVKNLKIIIQAGPGKDKSDYISHLNKLKSAIEYFDMNKNQTQKRENEALWLEGKTNLEKEFEHLLNKHAGVSEIYINGVNGNIDFYLDDMISDDQTDSNDPNEQQKESDIKQMVNILTWFREVEPTFLDKLYEKLIRFRSELILSAMKKIKEARANSIGNYGNQGGGLTHNNSSSSVNQLGGSTPQRTSLTPTSSSSSANLLSVPNGNKEKNNSMGRRITEMRRRGPAAGAFDNGTINGMGTQRSNHQLMAAEQDFESVECQRFIECLRKSLVMFAAEYKFIGQLVDMTKDRVIACKILERIYDPVLRSFNVEAERLASNAKQITSKMTSKFVIGMFDVLREFTQMKDKFLRVLEQSNANVKTSRYINIPLQHFLEIFVIIEKACYTALKNILEEIQSDPPTIQPNGNIHPITTETITFVENLLPFDVIAGCIASIVVSLDTHVLPIELEIAARKEASKNNEAKLTRVSYTFTDSNKHTYRVALAEYYYKMFKWLNVNLKTKADKYEDKYLKCIFLLNNTYKISKLFSPDAKYQFSKQANQGACKSLNELFLLTKERDLRKYYDEEIRQHKKEYSKCWSHLLEYIKDFGDGTQFTDAKLKDKERQMLKDRFSGFNKEFEEIYETQKRYFIPSQQIELAENLRQDNSVYIIGQYKRFYDKYSPINFATNRDKYVRYTPEMLKEKMKEFFTAL